MKALRRREVKPVASKRFQVELPDELVDSFGWNEAEVPGRVREALVMDLLRLDRISEATAAHLLGLDRWQLLETMGKYQVPAVRMSPEELQEELHGEIKRSKSA